MGRHGLAICSRLRSAKVQKKSPARGATVLLEANACDGARWLVDVRFFNPQPMETFLSGGAGPQIRGKSLALSLRLSANAERAEAQLRGRRLVIARQRAKEKRKPRLGERGLQGNG